MITRSSKKRSLLSSVIALLLCFSLLSMSFPGMSLASEQSDQTAVTTTTTDQLDPEILENSTPDKTEVPTAATTTTAAAPETNAEDSDTSAEAAKTNEQSNEILKTKEAELKNHKPVNTPSDETLTDEFPTDDPAVDNLTPTTDSKPVKEKKILKELVDQREANVKYFLMDDLSKEAGCLSGSRALSGQWAMARY